jgi:hypothetical protein
MKDKMNTCKVNNESKEADILKGVSNNQFIPFLGASSFLKPSLSERLPDELRLIKLTRQIIETY